MCQTVPGISSKVLVCQLDMNLWGFYTLLTTKEQCCSDQIFRYLWVCCLEHLLVGGFGLSKLFWESGKKTRPRGLHSTFTPHAMAK